MWFKKTTGLEKLEDANKCKCKQSESLLEHPIWGNTRRRNTMSEWQGVTFSSCCMLGQMLQSKTRSWSMLPLMSISTTAQKLFYWWTAHLRWRSLFYIDVGGSMLYSQCQCLLPAYRTLVTAWSALWTGQLGGRGGWHCWKHADGLLIKLTLGFWDHVMTAFVFTQ